MKAFLSILLLTTLTISAAPATSRELKAVLFEKLATNQDKTEGLYEVSGRVLRVGGHAVDLTPIVESESSAQGKSIVALKIELAVDGVRRSEATFGAIGIADSPEEAVAVALGEWYLGFAVPFFQAIRESRPSIAVAGYDVFAGALGLRGGASQSWIDGSDAMNRKILGALLPALSSKGDFVTLDLKVMVPAAGRPKSECRISGDVSTEIASSLVALDWPRTAGGYLFKQAFVLKKTKPNQTVERTAPSGGGSP